MVYQHGHALHEIIMAAYIGASLIPYEPFYGVAFDGAEHGVVHQERPAVVRHRLYGFMVKILVCVLSEHVFRYPTFHACPSVCA